MHQQTLSGPFVAVRASPTALVLRLPLVLFLQRQVHCHSCGQLRKERQRQRPKLEQRKVPCLAAADESLLVVGPQLESCRALRSALLQAVPPGKLDATGLLLKEVSGRGRVMLSGPGSVESLVRDLWKFGFCDCRVKRARLLEGATGLTGSCCGLLPRPSTVIACA
jgi:hypothetical protein